MERAALEVVASEKFTALSGRPVRDDMSILTERAARKRIKSETKHRASDRGGTVEPAGTFCHLVHLPWTRARGARAISHREMPSDHRRNTSMARRSSSMPPPSWAL